MSGYEEVFVRLRSATTGEWFAHPDLRGRLVDDVREQGTNMTAVVGAILSEAFSVRFDPPTRRTDPSTNPDYLALRLPSDLVEAIRRRHGKHTSDGIIACLSRHYGLTVPARAPRRRPRAAAA